MFKTGERNRLKRESKGPKISPAKKNLVRTSIRTSKRRNSKRLGAQESSSLMSSCPSPKGELKSVRPIKEGGKNKRIPHSPKAVHFLF